MLRRSTQPAHLVVMSAVLILAFMFYPTTKPMDYVTEEIQSESTLWPLLYLSSFSILFGAQMWMTFVSGWIFYFRFILTSSLTTELINYTVYVVRIRGLELIC